MSQFYTTMALICPVCDRLSPQVASNLTPGSEGVLTDEAVGTATAAGWVYRLVWSGNQSCSGAWRCPEHSQGETE